MSATRACLRVMQQTLDNPVSVLEADLDGQVGRLTIRAALAVRGGPLVLVGPNGSGKTSILLMILGIIQPRTGRIVLGGRVLYDAERRLNVPTEQRGLGYVPQDYGLFPHMTVLENVAFALGCRDPRAPKRAREAQALETLQGLQVQALSHRHPATLSGGERQRVALARALAARPRALLLDEPLTALDTGARRQVRAFLGSYLRELGLPAIVVTHDPVDAAALGQSIAVIEAGRIVQLGTFTELQACPASPFVEEFIACAATPRAT